MFIFYTSDLYVLFCNLIQLIPSLHSKNIVVELQLKINPAEYRYKEYTETSTFLTISLHVQQCQADTSISWINVEEFWNWKLLYLRYTVFNCLKINKIEISSLCDNTTIKKGSQKFYKISIIFNLQLSSVCKMLHLQFYKAFFIFNFTKKIHGVIEIWKSRLRATSKVTIKYNKEKQKIMKQRSFNRHMHTFFKTREIVPYTV